MIRFDKASIKKDTIKKLFDRRKKAAAEEYRKAVEGTGFAHQVVIYKSKLFNPLDLKPRDIAIEPYELREGSDHANRLDRYIRIIDDMERANAELTYILNFVHDLNEYLYITKNTPFETDSERLKELDSFKERIKDKLTFLRRLTLMSDMLN